MQTLLGDLAVVGVLLLWFYGACAVLYGVYRLLSLLGTDWEALADRVFGAEKSRTRKGGRGADGDFCNAANKVSGNVHWDKLADKVFNERTKARSSERGKR